MHLSCIYNLDVKFSIYLYPSLTVSFIAWRNKLTELLIIIDNSIYYSLSYLIHEESDLLERKKSLSIFDYKNRSIMRAEVKNRIVSVF